MNHRPLRLMVGSLLLAMCSDAIAGVLCTSKNGTGTLKLRDACRPSELQVDPVALGLRGPPGPTGPEGPQGPPGTAAVVKDAMGRLVGQLYPETPVSQGLLFDNSLVIREVQGRGLLLLVGETGFLRTPPLLFFETTTCAGSPFFGMAVGSPPPGLLLTSAFVEGSTAYYPSSGSPVMRTLLSSRAGTSGECVALDTPLALNRREVVTFDLGSLGVVAPFHAEGP